MPQIYDRNDLAWTFRGDYILSHDGDIADTRTDPLRSIYQEIRDIVRSDVGSWRIYPTLGAGLADLVGEPNDKRTAEAIKTKIVASLTRRGLVNTSDLKVLYIPVDIDKIIFRISLQVAPTAANQGSNTLDITFGYNYSENNVYVVN